MQVPISIVGGDQAELESMDDWLRGERELAGRVTLASARPRDGGLGDLGEVLIVAFGGGITMSVLAASLMASPR